ncbi:MAG: alpha/beta hydrolase [Bacteroidales bacterium]|nr:alpha/beta hydrolase [Bacteroidales bacterium]
MKEYINIGNDPDKTIPAILWGDSGDRMMIAVHGDLSNKEDTIIELLARTLIPKGYRVLSFDLPEHGERKNREYVCNPQNCISDLQAVDAYARSISTDISLFACSIGAYFSLLAFPTHDIRKFFLLSPIINMENVIQNMMAGFQVSEQRLRDEKKILLPIGKTLDWDYYTYVRQHPVDSNLNSAIAVLYGSKDTLTTQEEIMVFSEKNQAVLTIMEGGEHFFSSNKQLSFFEAWLNENL